MTTGEGFTDQLFFQVNIECSECGQRLGWVGRDDPIVTANRPPWLPSAEVQEIPGSDPTILQLGCTECTSREGRTLTRQVPKAAVENLLGDLYVGGGPKEASIKAV